LLQSDRGQGLLFSRLTKGVGMFRQDLFKFLALNIAPKPPSASINLVLDLIPFDATLRIGRTAWKRRVSELIDTHNSLVLE